MDYVATILPIIERIGPLSYWIVLAAAMAESVAIVGSFVPGSTIVVISGFLAGQGYFGIVDLMVFSSVGAILGDIFSYYLGTKGLHFFKEENKYLKKSHLERGEAFFKKHGNKSVFLGRFIAPLRAIVPFVAGLSRMNKASFLFWNVLSGILWATSHVLLGYFFGDAWRQIETWSTRVGIVGIALVLIAALIYLIRQRE